MVTLRVLGQLWVTQCCKLATPIARLLLTDTTHVLGLGAITRLERLLRPALATVRVPTNL